MELTSLQKDTVEKILECYIPTEKVICEFKSPTGSGKTLMSSYFISSMIERNTEDKFIFVVAMPSSSSLPLFFEQKINKYKKDLPYSKFEVEYIQSPSSAKTDKTESIKKILPEQNKVYIFGKSSFGKGRILSEYGIIDDFIISAIDKGYKLIYIRDEAHIGGEKTDNSENAKNFESLMIGNASFVLKMTATPDFHNTLTKKVILKESELNNPFLNNDKWLLKTYPVSLLDHNLEDKQILNDAIQNFKKIKKDYENLNVNIHPAMLIQIDNDSPSDKERKKLFNDTLYQIKQTLSNNNISWVQYFGNNDKDSNRVYKGDFSLDDISQNDNEIDAIIFKIGPSTGWDIPRACMLIQLRPVSSSSLNIQTLGRIKRNPYPNLEKNEITDKYYIYSNKEQTNADDIQIFNYKVKNEFASEGFLVIDILNKENIKSSSSLKDFEKEFNLWLEEDKNIIIGDINSRFRNNGYKKIRTKANGHCIYTFITNPFIFLRDYNKLIIANKFIYESIIKSVEEFSKEVSIRKEFIITILLNNYKQKIKEIFSKTKNCQPKYKITEQKYNPDSYLEIYSNNLIKEKIPREYLFDINKDKANLKNQQPLDSKPEDCIFNAIYDFVGEHDDSIKLWAKNQTTSNIFGEYLDDTWNIRKSYFDFIIKFKNGVYLYIEAKGEKDINPEKTKQLQSAYSDYFEHRMADLFSSKLIIALCKVDNEDNIRFANSIYYDKNQIKEDLTQLSFDDLLETLSNI